jgi:hypothetical protein
LIDTLTDRSSAYRVLQPPGLLNTYAAMPSRHFGSRLLVGIAVFRATTNPFVRIGADLLPVAMVVAVVATASHFVLDAVAGAAVALAGLAPVRPVTGAIRPVRTQLRL